MELDRGGGESVAVDALSALSILILDAALSVYACELCSSLGRSRGGALRADVDICVYMCGCECTSGLPTIIPSRNCVRSVVECRIAGPPPR